MEVPRFVELYSRVLVRSQPKTADGMTLLAARKEIRRTNDWACSVYSGAFRRLTSYAPCTAAGPQRAPGQDTNIHHLRFRHAEAYLGTIFLLTCHDGGIYDVLLVRCVSASCSGPSRCSSAEWDKLRA